MHNVLRKGVRPWAVREYATHIQCIVVYTCNALLV